MKPKQTLQSLHHFTVETCETLWSKFDQSVVQSQQIT